MCGIAGFYITDPTFVPDSKSLDTFFDALLVGIEPRGRDATGYLALNVDGKLAMAKKATRASDFIKTRSSLPTPAPLAVLGHTRAATKGSPQNALNNHPVSSNSVFVTHNGVIYNDDELFEEYKLKRFGQVDTEAIPAVINHFGWDKLKDALEVIEGSYALAIHDFNHPGEVVLVKGPSSPLITLTTEKMLIWASTDWAIKEAYKKCGQKAPDSKLFREHKQGTIIRMKPGEQPEVVLDFFKPPTYTYTRSYTSSWSGGTGAGKSSYKILDNKAVVDELRKSGLSQTFTRFQWQQGKVDEKHRKHHNNSWSWCVHCKDSVADIDVYTTAVWGKICIDCLTIARADSKAQQTEREATFGKKFDLSSDDMQTLVTWADMDNEVHAEVLSLMAAELGVTSDFIDWLLFRAQLNSVSKISKEKVNNMWSDLFEIYTDTENEVWSNWPNFEGASCSVTTTEQVETTDTEQEALDLQPDPWIACGAGTHLASEECEACDRPMKVSELIESINNKPEKKPNNCLVCKKKAKLYLGSDMRWCATHWTKCKQRGCEKETVGWGPDNRRLCHTHFRGTKGGMLDGTFRHEVRRFAQLS